MLKPGSVPTIFPWTTQEISAPDPRPQRLTKRSSKCRHVAMAARESDANTTDDITTNDITTDDITTDQDLLYAAVKEEVDFKPSTQRAFTSASIKVEPVDCDGVLSIDDGPTDQVDILLAPIEEVDVDPPPVKTEPDQDDPWGRLQLDIPAQQDPLLLPADVKQEVKTELTSDGAILTSSYIKQEPDEADGVDRLWLGSVSRESDVAATNIPTLDRVASVGPKLDVSSLQIFASGFATSVTAKEEEEMPSVQRYLIPLVCDVCKDVFSTKTLLRRHIIKHFLGRYFACRKCAKQFGYEKDLILHTLGQHMPRHVVKNDNHTSTCVCVEQSSTGKQHLLTHTGEKPHACSVCSKGFTDSRNLKQHLLIHTGEKPHTCSVCSKRFNHSSHVKRHILTHTGEKPHVCSVCSMHFTDSSNLKIHILTHTGEKLYACSVCSQRFTQRRSVKIHMQRRHLDQ